MGLNYSFKLYTQREHIPQMLKAVADIASPLEKPNLSVTLDDGSQILLPFSSDFKTEPVSIPKGIGECQFDTVLLFPLNDDAVYRYCVIELPVGLEPAVSTINGKQYGAVGYIYLTLTTGNQYAEFDFMAATSNISRLFLNSTSIQSTFQKCLTQANGLFGIIDLEADDYWVLDDINRIVTLDFEEYYIEEEDSLLIDIDRWTEALLKEIPR